MSFVEVRKNDLLENSPADFVRVVCVARRLNISPKRVYQLIREKRLAAVKFGPRQTRVLRASLDEYIHERMVEDEDIINDE